MTSAIPVQCILRLLRVYHEITMWPVPRWLDSTAPVSHRSWVWILFRPEFSSGFNFTTVWVVKSVMSECLFPQFKYMIFHTFIWNDIEVRCIHLTVTGPLSQCVWSFVTALKYFFVCFFALPKTTITLTIIFGQFPFWVHFKDLKSDSAEFENRHHASFFLYNNWNVEILVHH